MQSTPNNNLILKVTLLKKARVTDAYETLVTLLADEGAVIDADILLAKAIKTKDYFLIRSLVWDLT